MEKISFALPSVPNLTTWQIWKLGIMDRHLTEAMKLFEEVEGNLYNSEDPTVLNSLHDLRRQTHLTKQILGDRMKGQKHLIPPVLFQARKATTSDMTYPVPEGYVPLPLINPDIDVDFGQQFHHNLHQHLRQLRNNSPLKYLLVSNLHLPGQKQFRTLSCLWRYL